MASLGPHKTVIWDHLNSLSASLAGTAATVRKINYKTDRIKAPMTCVQASPSALAFYDGAIRTLRIQVVAMSIGSAVGAASIVALEPQLGGVGAGTPIVPLSILVSESNFNVGRGIANHAQSNWVYSTPLYIAWPSGRKQKVTCC